MIEQSTISQLKTTKNPFIIICRKNIMTKSILQMDTYLEWDSTGRTNRDHMLQQTPLNLQSEFVAMI